MGAHDSFDGGDGLGVGPKIAGAMTLENLLYLVLGLAVMDLFVITLGIHCGLNYESSRTAIGVSLGSVFFLFLGVVTLLMFMISFSSSFQIQLAPFLAFVVGGVLVNPGDAVVASWRTEQVHLLEPDAAEGPAQPYAEDRAA